MHPSLNLLPVHQVATSSCIPYALQTSSWKRHQAASGLGCYIIDFIVHVSSHFLQSTLHCLCFISFPSVHTSLFMLHLISFSPHFIVHVPSHFLQSTFHWSCIIFISFRSQSISLILIYIKWSLNVIVSFNFQPILSLEINNLRVSLDKLLISNIYSLHEAEL